MAKGHRSQIKRERNANKDTRPSAKLSYARMSVQKAGFVLDAIRGKSVAEAFAILKFTPRGAASDVEKVLNSAVANAVNNFEMNEEDLYVKTCYVDEGIVLKRAKMDSRGHVGRNDHKTSHITVIVSNDKK